VKTPNENSVLQLAALPNSQGNMIFSLVNQRRFVHRDLKIRDLWAELKTAGDVWAIGVVNDRQETMGIIVVTQFQEKMNRPIAHDLLDRKSVVEVMTEAMVFPFDRTVASVSEDLIEDARKSWNRYFPVKDSQGKFCGIFSTKDLLVHQFNARQAEVELAAKIQRAIVPQTIERRAAGLDIFAFAAMARGADGDFLAVRESRPGKWLCSVCEISGEGITTNLISAALGGMLVQYDPDGGIVPFVTRLNSFVANTFRMEKGLNGAFLKIDENGKSLIFCGLGHSHFGLVRDGVCRKSLISESSDGSLPVLEVNCEEFGLRSGDLFFVYTDGFVNQKNLKDEEFGIERLESLLVENREKPPAELAGFLHRGVAAFRGDRSGDDDEAILLVRVN
jgi:serine phosphatase RsbU (regulator of sigma subunit)